jgi:hypothetical protein
VRACEIIKLITNKIQLVVECERERRVSLACEIINRVIISATELDAFLTNEDDDVCNAIEESN